MMLVPIILLIALAVFMIICMWKVFEKANQPGWACIVPVYNNMVMAEIGGKKQTWGLLTLIPYAGIIWAIWIQNRLAKSFGKNEGFTVGLIFLPMIFWPILAFGDATHQAAAKPESVDLLDS